MIPRVPRRTTYLALLLLAFAPLPTVSDSAPRGPVSAASPGTWVAVHAVPHAAPVVG